MSGPDVKVWPVTPGLLSEDSRWHQERQELLWARVSGNRPRFSGSHSPWPRPR